MSGNPLIIFDSLALTLSIIIAIPAAYRAITSRRVLTTPLYRNRALWTGTVALMLAVIDAFAIIIENTSSSVTFGIVPPPGTSEFYVFVVLTAAFSAVAFAWIDSTIGVALELDFLHRDVLDWKKVRLLAGAAIVTGTVVAQFVTTDWELVIAVVLLAPPAAYMAASLVVGGRRVRDETVRRYIRWMGFLVVALLMQVGTTAISPYLNFPLAIAAFTLYGMSASLLKTAPLRAATIDSSASGNLAGREGQGPIQAPR